MQKEDTGVRWLTGQQPIPLHGRINSFRSALPPIIGAKDGVRVFHVIQRQFYDVALVPTIAKDRAKG